jgi:hypothetical protein
MQRPTLSATSIFSAPSLPLEPGFENIGPETPMRPLLADPEGAGYRAFGGMPPQGAGRDAKHPCGLRKPDGPPFVERGKDHMSSLVWATSALHPWSLPSIVPGSSSCAAIWPSRTRAAPIRVSIIACISSWLRTVLRLGVRGTQPLLFQANGVADRTMYVTDIHRVNLFVFVIWPPWLRWPIWLVL